MSVTQCGCCILNQISGFAAFSVNIVWVVSTLWQREIRMVDKLGNWRRPLVRLAAEFAVVVLGVTIALWADGWVAERNDRAVEAARLGALQDNVNVTLADLREARDNARGAAAALRRLMSLQEHHSHDDEMGELLRYGLTYGPNFFPELNVYDDLKNSGELALLTNPELRRSLASMDARLELAQFVQADLITVMQLNFDSYLITHFDLRWLYGPLTGLADVIDASEIDLGFMSDMEFQNLLVFKLDMIEQVDAAFQKTEIALMAVQQTIALQLATQRRRSWMNSD